MLNTLDSNKLLCLTLQHDDSITLIFSTITKKKHNMRYSKLRKILIISLAAFLFNAGIALQAQSTDYTEQDSVVLARRLLNNGNVNEAEVILNNEIKNNPKNTRAYIELAEICISKNQLSKAKGLLNKAFDLEPNNPKAYSLTASLLYKNSQFDQAEQIARKTLAMDDSDSNSYLILGRIYIDRAENQQYLPQSKVDSLRKEGYRNFKLASKYNPASADTHIGLAKVYLREGKDEKALDELLIAEELGFSNPDILYFIGESYYQLGKYEKAIKFLKKPVVYNSGKYYRSHFILANVYEKLGNADTAKREYLATLKYKPNDVEARVRLDQLNENIEISQRLESNTVLVKNIEEKSIESLNTLADYYLVMDKLPQARDLYRQVLEKDSNNLRARVGLCELYYAQWILGYFNPKTYYADRLYLEDDLDYIELTVPLVKVKITSSQGISPPVKEELLEISGNTDQNPQNLINVSRAAFLLGNYKMSKKILGSLVVRSLSDYERFELAKGLFLDRNFYESRTLLKSLQSSYPDEIIASMLNRIEDKIRLSESIVDEGVKLYKKKDYQAAILKYKQALKKFPLCKIAHIQYAHALYKIGNKDKANEMIDLYQMLEDMYPTAVPELSWKEVQKIKESWLK